MDATRFGVLSQVAGSSVLTSFITNPVFSRPRSNEIAWSVVKRYYNLRQSWATNLWHVLCGCG